MLQMNVSLVVTNFSQYDSVFPQSVRVDFVDYTVLQAQVVQPYSGNPGYIYGYPVLVSRAGRGGRVGGKLINASPHMCIIQAYKCMSGLRARLSCP